MAHRVLDVRCDNSSTLKDSRESTGDSASESAVTKTCKFLAIYEHEIAVQNKTKRGVFFILLLLGVEFQFDLLEALAFGPADQEGELSTLPELCTGM